MKKITFGIFLLWFAGTAAFVSAQPQNLTLANFSSNFNEPLDVTHAGDDRIFVVEKDGRVQIIDQSGIKNAFPYLDIVGRVGSSASERGLLGIAFHPRYQENGYFYVNYTNNSGNTVIARFTVSGNADLADASSELIMLTIQQPYSNHNGGCLRFGHDGYLYIGMGDGGSGGDPLAHGQNTTSLLGKILRLDVDNGTPYSIPTNNPYINDPGTSDEIWAIGVRNPWRFSFDKKNGDLWIGDVGQNNWEEIDYWPASNTSAPNFGWRCYEGNNTFNTAGCASQSNYDFPVYVYPNNFSDGCSVTGGVRYRGPFHQNLWGLYFHTDYCSGNFWYTQGNGTNWTTVKFASLNGFDYAGLGEDVYGQVYVCGISSGNIYKFTDTTCTPNASILVANDTLPVCDTAMVRLDAPYHPSMTISWLLNGSPIVGADSGFIMASQAGQYSVILVNGSCRDTSDMVQVNFGTSPAGVSISGLSPGYCSFDGAVTMTGNPAGGTFSGAGVSGNVFDPANAGLGNHPITYSYTNASGCTSENIVSVMVSACPGISPATVLDGFTLYPNPTENSFNVEFAVSSDVEAILTVVNMMGEIVIERPEFFESGQQKIFVDLPSAADGLYFLKIRIANAEFVQKFVVQH